MFARGCVFVKWKDDIYIKIYAGLGLGLRVGLLSIERLCK